MKKINVYKILVLVFVCMFLMAGAWRGKKLTNPWIKGVPIATSTWAGLETWGTTGTADTFTVSGIDSTWYVFINAVDSTSTGLIHTYISRNGDSVFVRCDSSKTADEFKYNWMVLSP